MKQNQKGIAILLVILVVILLIGVAVGGYLFFFNPKAQIERAIKPDTSLDNRFGAPRTEITESGYNVEVVIKPSSNNIISDKVTIAASQVSEEAAGVGFFITKDEQGFMDEGLPNISLDSSAADGWDSELDTTEYDNGEYYIIVIVYPEGGEGDPLGIAQIPVKISN